MSGTALIDPRAAIAEGAKLAPDVEVGAYAIIGPDVEIGPGCRIGPHAVVTGWTRLGANNRVFQFASIGDAPQDKKYKGEPTRVEIGEGNVFREYVTVNRGTTHDKAITRIGNDNLFMASSHVAHDCIVGSHCVFANLATLGGHVEVDDHVILAGERRDTAHVGIGAHAMLGMFTSLTQDVPPFVILNGNPAEPHSINATGLSRRGFSPEQVRNIKNAFRTLYREGLPLETAIERLREAAATQPEIVPFVEFMGRSTRSLIR